MQTGPDTPAPKAVPPGTMAFVNRTADDIFQNLGPALRISLGPLVLAGVGLAVLNQDLLRAWMAGTLGTATFSQARVTVFVLSGLVVILATGYWVAVAWHRFLVLDERPGALLPRFHGGPVLRYALTSLIAVLLAGLVVLVYTLVLSPVVGPIYVQIGSYHHVLGHGPVLVVMNGIGTFLFVYVFLRFSPVLVARALGRPAGKDSALRQSAPLRGLILRLAAGYAVVTLLWTLFSAGVLTQLPVLAFAFNLFANWAAFMFSIGVLTRLYLEVEPQQHA